MSKTILEKINISDKDVENWKRRGLKITYPVRENPNYFKSDDGEIMIENADKFVPPLTKRETKIYIENPARFKKDLTKNARFLRKFVNFIYKKEANFKKLNGGEKVSALLSLLYLFQRAIDHHYYHWDRYLAYENYPQTPVGFWWHKLMTLHTKATKEKDSKQNPSEYFLRLLSGDNKILNIFKNRLSSKEFSELKKVLSSIKIFEEAQQKEVEFLVDYKTNENNVLIRTGFPILEEFWKEIDKSQGFIRKEYIPEIRKLKKIHPIICGRKLTLPEALDYFDNGIKSMVRREIKRWTR